MTAPRLRRFSDDHPSYDRPPYLVDEEDEDVTDDEPGNFYQLEAVIVTGFLLGCVCGFIGLLLFFEHPQQMLSWDDPLPTVHPHDSTPLSTLWPIHLLHTQLATPTMADANAELASAIHSAFRAFAKDLTSDVDDQFHQWQIDSGATFISSKPEFRAIMSFLQQSLLEYPESLSREHSRAHFPFFTTLSHRPRSTPDSKKHSLTALYCVHSSSESTLLTLKHSGQESDRPISSGDLLIFPSFVSFAYADTQATLRSDLVSIVFSISL